MKSVGQFFIGILTAAGTGLLVLAAISLALVEGGASRASSIPPTPSASATAGITILTPAGGVTLQPSPTRAVTVTQVQSSCNAPEGWVKYTVQSGDDLETVAARAGLSTDELMKANCMLTTTLLPGTLVSVPFIATETAEPTMTSMAPTRSTCGAPAGWVVYTVKSGDTLTKISQAVDASVNQIKQANCLSSSFIRTGMHLYVPSLPVTQPSVTSTPMPSPSVTASQPTVAETRPGTAEPTGTATLGTATFTPTPEPTTATPEPTTATTGTPTLETPTATRETTTPVPTTPAAPQPAATTTATQATAAPTEITKQPIK